MDREEAQGENQANRFVFLSLIQCVESASQFIDLQ